MIAKYSLMMDVEGAELQDDEKQMLSSPLIAGVILFSRNFNSSEQLQKLIKDIRNSRQQPLLIAVDHEGGRVQRFRTDGFTKLPAMGKLKSLPIEQQQQACIELGWLMASECIAHGIDLSFAPVLDLDRGSDVVGDRAFSSDINQTIQFAAWWCEGMKQAGMACVGKHFPGHGSTKEDSHIAAPIDQRDFKTLEQNDLQVFKSLIAEHTLDALMPAHIQFNKIDESPVGYSKTWIQQILKKQLNFNGVLFSDDLSMVGAGEHLSYIERAELCLSAGCDIALICNNKKAVQEVLQQVDVSALNSLNETNPVKQFITNSSLNLEQLQQSERWQNAMALAGAM